LGSGTNCLSSVTFESFSTAQVGRIVVPYRETLTAEPGALVVHDGDITYAASIPEPGTYALTAPGTLALMSGLRQRARASE
jgi:hypothetical protein